MLCDRCAINGECKYFKPRGQCLLERKSFRRVVAELIDEFELESVADRILVERAAMYLIRIARAEAYEASVGVTDSSALWGGYISRLDNTLRGLLNDLAVTRLKRKQLEKSEALLVSVDDVLKKFAKSEARAEPRRHGRIEVEERRALVVQKRALISDWRMEYSKLGLSVRKVR